MKPPKASFVIPAYNAEAFLSQTIRSCQVQSVKDIEIIVVDNGSTDGTSELCECLVQQDPRLKYVHCPTERNRSAARNFGNAIASAPIIMALDSDDIALKNRVRDTLLTFQMKNPDVVYGPFQVINEHGEIVGMQKAGKVSREIWMDRKENYIGHSTMAYRKGVTTNVQYDEAQFSELGLDDWKFQWDCVQKGYKFEVCSVPLARYRFYQLPDGSYGSPTEFMRDNKRVEALKNEYLDRIRAVTPA